MRDIEAPVPSLGDVFARRYRLLERLPEGGGRLFRARDEILARDVAVKVFEVDPAATVDSRRRLAGARMLTALDHPALVTIYDAHLGHGGESYLVMEFIHGPTLRRHIGERGPLAPALAAAILRDVALGLAAIHDLGIVHRHLTAENVLLRPLRNAGRPFRGVLADFGVTHLLGERAPETPVDDREYLPPERLHGEEPHAASDIFALGQLAMEALTAERPLSGGPVQELLLAPLSYDPEIPTRYGYGWELLLTAMTDPDPDARPTAIEVAELAIELAEDFAAPAATPEPATPETDDADESAPGAEPVAAVRAVHQSRETATRRRRPPIWAWVTHYR
jgi:serine/threonine protein kinase